MDDSPRIGNRIGFRIGRLAYLTDVSGIPEASRRLLGGLDTLVLGALRPEPHPMHFSRSNLISGTAFLLSVLLSVLLARRFIRPLGKMQAMAADLTGGDYTARTGIEQDDEIGSLARSLDILSLRLAEAEKEKAVKEALESANTDVKAGDGEDREGENG